MEIKPKAHLQRAGEAENPVVSGLDKWTTEGVLKSESLVFYDVKPTLKGEEYVCIP